jgi:hypothetical protein
MRAEAHREGPFSQAAIQAQFSCSVAKSNLKEWPGKGYLKSEGKKERMGLRRVRGLCMPDEEVRKMGRKRREGEQQKYLLKLLLRRRADWGRRRAAPTGRRSGKREERVAAKGYGRQPDGGPCCSVANSVTLCLVLDCRCSVTNQFQADRYRAARRRPSSVNDRAMKLMCMHVPRRYMCKISRREF